MITAVVATEPYSSSRTQAGTCQAFLELRRVLGNEKMHDLWFQAAATATSDLSDRQASDK